MSEELTEQEGFTAESAHAFSVIFDDGTKHIFLADSARHVQQWLAALKKARWAQSFIN